MGNPIQYHNTDNPSKMGGVSHNCGGVCHNNLSLRNPPGSFTMGKPLWYDPRGVPQRGEGV